MASQAKSTAAKIDDDYLELIKRFPLVSIRNDRHIKGAHRVIDHLSVVGEDKLSEGQLSYLLVSGDLASVREGSQGRAASQQTAR